MAQTDVILPVEPAADLPVIRSIGLADLRDALAKGLDDFRAMPTHAVFLCLIYPIVGVALGSATSVTMPSPCSIHSPRALRSSVHSPRSVSTS